jgi:Protein of unknown function (DUF3224)
LEQSEQPSSLPVRAAFSIFRFASSRNGKVSSGTEVATANGSMIIKAESLDAAVDIARGYRMLRSGFRKEALMTDRALGTFEVKLDPEPSDEFIGRMSMEKQFTGDLQAVSRGQMLNTSTEIEGSAGYVAMERVSGTLKGRHGTFVLQHSGTMDRGRPQLAVNVVPDSGTGELVGLSGTMMITITDGKHSYDFEYSL